MVVIGIVGGVASGKSFVAEQFRRLGAEVLDADKIGHEVLDDPDVKESLRSRWGEAAFGRGRRVDRAAVAKIVFAPPPQGTEALAYLEGLTHPKIGARLRASAAELARRGNVKVVVLDAAVLLKAGWDELCDKIVFVEAAESERLKRARRRGWSRADFTAREASQEKLDGKRKRADWVIDNGGSPEHTFAQVQQFWRTLD